MPSGLMTPEPAVIRAVREVTPDTLLFQVDVERPAGAAPFDYLPGQFAELSVLGVGECPISITSTPTRPGLVEFAVREAGDVTRALHDLVAGDRLGLRGPLGNGFPLPALEGRSILFIAGGIGLAPLRGLINFVLDRRERFGAVDIVYGARSPELLCFDWEFETWAAAPDTALHLTVDAAAPGWDGEVGFVPAMVRRLGLEPADRVAVACGPPIMIKYVLDDLAAAGYGSDDVITTLELKMKCGVGKCGRCNIGPRYVCLDGPVFTLSQLERLPREY
ncbi:MAG TPA: FAD/NAD(P)-binding protein [Polyangia bacterium]|nr:FAD/NAD(P)-binding protein [Polyangia bacterium]